MQQEYKYGELTHRIIGCSTEVHRVLGNGFQEVIYQRSLSYELEQINVGFAIEVDMPIFYKGILMGTRRADFLIEEKVMVELKAIIKLEEVHLAQAINYLEAYNLEIGLLINFGASSLEFKRVLNPHFRRFYPN